LFSVDRSSVVDSSQCHPVEEAREFTRHGIEGRECPLSILSTAAARTAKISCRSGGSDSSLVQTMYVAGIVRQPAFVTVSPNDRTLCGTGGAALGRPLRDVSPPATGNSGPGGSDSEHEAARDLVRF
jgi:hypothetical protein